MKKITQKKKKIVRSRSTFKPRGVSKVVLLCIVAVLLLGAGGYFFMNQQKGTNSNALPFIKPALNPNCKYNDPELCKFINNMQVHSELSVLSKGSLDGMSVETLTEVSGENKYHTITKMNGKEASNMISIGDSTYTLDYTDNTWWKQTYTSDESNTTAGEENKLKDTYTFKNEEGEDKTSYKFIAKESCNERTCFKYQMINPNETEYEVFIWFDDKEYLIRKMTYGQKDQIVNESVYTYGAVTIKEPSPIKEGTPTTYGNEDVLQTDPAYNELMQDMKSQMQEVNEQMPVGEESSY